MDYERRARAQKPSREGSRLPSRYEIPDYRDQWPNEIVLDEEGQVVVMRVGAFAPAQFEYSPNHATA